MDLTSSVRTDALPAVASIMVPGALASLPYLALVWGHPHNLKAFVEAREGVSTAVGVLLLVGSGFLIESVGSYVEYYVIDRFHGDRTAMLQRWRDYLRLAWTTEPVGQHYLRRILIVFKFELNLLVATTAGIPAVFALACYGVLTPLRFGLILCLQIGLALYLTVAAIASSKLLDELRGYLLRQREAQP